MLRRVLAAHAVSKGEKGWFLGWKMMEVLHASSVVLSGRMGAIELGKPRLKASRSPRPTHTSKPVQAHASRKLPPEGAPLGLHAHALSSRPPEEKGQSGQGKERQSEAKRPRLARAMVICFQNRGLCSQGARA